MMRYVCELNGQQASGRPLPSVSLIVDGRRGYPGKLVERGRTFGQPSLLRGMVKLLVHSRGIRPKTMR
jgi:hypothetical protein